MGTRYPDRPEPGDPRYARRDRHDLSHRSRPPVGAPAERSFRIRYGRSSPEERNRAAPAPAGPRRSPRAAPGCRSVPPRDRTSLDPANGYAVVDENTSRAEFRRRRYYVHPERRFLTFGCRRASDGGAPFWSHGSLLSGSRHACHRRRSETSVLRGQHDSRGVGRRSPVSIATKGHVMAMILRRRERPPGPPSDAPRRAAEAGGRGAAPPLMRRRERNSAGAHFQSPETARPPSLPRRLPNPENRVWGRTSYFAGVNSPAAYFSPRWRSHSRGWEPAPVSEVKVVTPGVNSASKGAPRQTLELHH